METTAVRVDNLWVNRGKSSVLNGLSFSIEQGAVTGLLGPSGSGKTTLMRAIVGVQKISAGTVTVLRHPAGSPSLRHDVGYVTQAPSIYRDITVEENVRYFGALHSMPASRTAEAIDAVGLSRFAARKTSDLSGGQFSRVSLACALVAEPDLLILDEPTVGLDPVLRVELWERFAAMAQAGTTLLVSSHVMEEASHCDSLLLSREGRLLGQLTPDELRKSGQSDELELAFLRLIRAEEAAEPTRRGTA